MNVADEVIEDVRKFEVDLRPDGVEVELVEAVDGLLCDADAVVKSVQVEIGGEERIQRIFQA